MTGRAKKFFKLGGKKTGVIFCLTAALFFSPLLAGQDCRANNIKIKNVSLEDRNSEDGTAVVEFDVSWDNSWRDDTNHDAVWVFIKVLSSALAGADHASLKTAGINPKDTFPGSNTDLNILVTPDRVGAFLSRKAKGSGTMSSEDVRLTIDYAALSGVEATTTIKALVFGVEMVYIPGGEFELGDGNGSSESTYAFHDGTTNSKVTIRHTLTGDIRVDANSYDESQIETTGIGILGDQGIDTDDNGTIDNFYFPTGYMAFYLMKYELTQGQYRDFLNTLSLDKQKNRVAATLDGDERGDHVMISEDGSLAYAQGIIAVNDPPSGPYRFGLDADADNIPDEHNDGEWRAMNYLSWMDFCAYADWAGLRPMTELEFEKAARGGNQSAVYNEKAWGNSTITNSSALYFPGEAGEYAFGTASNLNYTSAYLEQPYRVGAFAYSASTRASAGAGYYGNMELSGNLFEHVVSVGRTWAAGYFQGTHGDGVLWTASAGTAGNATNTDWPGFISGSGVVSGSNAVGQGQRGGSFPLASNYCTISDRSYASYNSSIRSHDVGGRYARTSPYEGPETVFFVTTADHNGDFNTGLAVRYTVDKFCIDNKPANLPADCYNIRAFLAISSSDEPRRFPQLYGFQRNNSCYWWNAVKGGVTKFASDWADMFDSSIEVSASDGGVSANIYYQSAWTGSYSAGYTGAVCSTWDSSSGIVVGYYGDFSGTNQTWIFSNTKTCDTSLPLYCVCQYEVE